MLRDFDTYAMHMWVRAKPVPFRWERAACPYCGHFSTVRWEVTGRGVWVLVHNPMNICDHFRMCTESDGSVVFRFNRES